MFDVPINIATASLLTCRSRRATALFIYMTTAQLDRYWWKYHVISLLRSLKVVYKAAQIQISRDGGETRRWRDETVER